MWDAFLKLQFEGKWWKISVVMFVAKVLRLDRTLFSGGTFSKGHQMTEQFFIPKWINNPKEFAKDYRKTEALYGNTPTDLEVERAYQRYLSKVK